MKYNITEIDKLSLLQPVVQYKYRLYIIDNERNILDNLEGVRNIGGYTIDSQSNVRRTSSFTLKLDQTFINKSIEKRIYSWIGYNFQFQIGIFNLRKDDFIWYDCGYYAITSSNTSYSSTTNELTVSLSDWVVKLDGTRNGVIGGSPTITIPVEDEDGNKTIIKNALISFLQLSTDIKNFIVDDIGEFYALQENNIDWEKYREDRPEWNILPYDLDFDGSSTILEILSKLCELYPNYQYYFDIYGNFCVSMIPSCESSPIILNNNYLQRILISDSPETVSYDTTLIKNITEVFGKTYEIDRMSTECITSVNIYTVKLEGFTSYENNIYIAITVNASNIENMKLKINNLDVIPIYKSDLDEYIQAGLLEKDEIYVLKLKKVSGSFRAYFLGQYQPHALCVLTNSENNELYTKEYFSEKYNCSINNIVFRVEKDSPFVIQKVGEILDYKSGDDFENIESDSVALENAIYYNKQSTTFMDTVTITTKLIPFIDVYEKVTYKRKQEQEEHPYIIQSINHDLDGMTSTITMHRFYPLYLD